MSIFRVDALHAAFLAVLLAPAAVQAEMAVTIYSKATPGAVNPELYRPTPGRGDYTATTLPGYAIVRDGRQITLPAGRSSFALADVAALIDPTTVRFESLTDPKGTRVIEQDFRFDLVSTDKLLQRYLGEPITVEQALGDGVKTVSGNLLSTEGGLILQQADGSVEIVTSWQGISLSELPGGLMTRPTLVWDIDARRSGKHDARISYETAGATWWADYNLNWAPGADENKGTLSVAAWVSIINRTGTAFADAQLKLIAGDVQRASSSVEPMRAAMVRGLAMAEDAAGFEEKAFFEFHLYTLGRTTTVPDNATKQIELFPQVESVPATKRLVYNGFPFGRQTGFGVQDGNFGTQSNSKVDVYIEFVNRKADGLGMPLPAGRIRISQVDKADGTLEFIGEDVIDHTPRNEDVRIRLGASFDVVGERKQTRYEIDSRARWIEEEIEVTLTNRKDTAQAVSVAEPLYRYANWTISEQSDKYKKIDSRMVHFDVTVPADGKKTIRYKVRYTW